MDKKATVVAIEKIRLGDNARASARTIGIEGSLSAGKVLYHGSAVGSAIRSA